MDVIEENKSLKKRLEYLEKSMRSMEIELRLERANKILKINELLDRISLLEKYRAVKD
jgi:flagellar hook-associated protein FlgK